MAKSRIHKACPICGRDQFKPSTTFQSIHLASCRNCGMSFVLRIPTEEELNEYYSHYARERYVSDLTIAKYKSLLEKFNEYQKTGNLLDVGCGSGFFLDVVKQSNWKGIGTEYGEASVQFCRKKGLDVYEGAIENQTFEKEIFDVVTSFEVIEHLSYPIEHLERIFELLRPGGLLYITTPNFGSISRSLLKTKWKVIGYPEHLSYFSAKTLDYSLKLVGFKKIRLFADGLNIDGLQNALHKKRVVHENNAPTSKANKVSITNESVRRASENNKAFRLLRKLIDWGLNQTQKGEFLKGYYIKPKSTE